MPINDEQAEAVPTGAADRIKSFFRSFGKFAYEERRVLLAMILAQAAVSAITHFWPATTDLFLGFGAAFSVFWFADMWRGRILHQNPSELYPLVMGHEEILELAEKICSDALANPRLSAENRVFFGQMLDECKTGSIPGPLAAIFANHSDNYTMFPVGIPAHGAFVSARHYCMEAE